MEWINEKWDRLILAIVALIVIVVAALFVKKSLAYGEQFETETAEIDGTLPINSAEVDRVATSTRLVTQDVRWDPPIREIDDTTMTVRLFVSVPIVEVSGNLINMRDPNARLVRAPASNQWLLDNKLDFLDATVLDQDPDGDGFKNLEEWNAKTLPNDASSHPSYAEKLSLLGRFSQNYTLTFSSQLDPERFQITREQTANFPRDTSIMRIGETSTDGKFRLDKFEKKEGLNDLGVTVDKSEVTITYLETGKQEVLVRQEPKTIPTFYAQLKFELSGKPSWEDYVKLGDTFKLPIDPETEYKLISVEPDEAEITYQPQPGQEKTVKIQKKS